jgi:hypothetical protein
VTCGDGFWCHGACEHARACQYPRRRASYRREPKINGKWPKPAIALNAWRMTCNVAMTARLDLRGWAPWQIASFLGVSERAVRRYLSAIRPRLNVD